MEQCCHWRAVLLIFQVNSSFDFPLCLVFRIDSLSDYDRWQFALLSTPAAKYNQPCRCWLDRGKVMWLHERTLLFLWKWVGHTLVQILFLLLLERSIPSSKICRFQGCCLSRGALSWLFGHQKWGIEWLALDNCCEGDLCRCFASHKFWYVILLKVYLHLSCPVSSCLPVNMVIRFWSRQSGRDSMAWAECEFTTRVINKTGLIGSG